MERHARAVPCHEHVDEQLHLVVLVALLDLVLLDLALDDVDCYFTKLEHDAVLEGVLPQRPYHRTAVVAERRHAVEDVLLEAHHHFVL